MTEEAPKSKLRPMRKDELVSLETLLAYYDIEAEFSHWIDHGEPTRHIWQHIRALLDYLHNAKPETTLGYPTVRVEKLKVPALPFDNEEI